MKELNDIRSSCKIPKSVIQSFINSSISDINFQKITSQKSLLEYCYGWRPLLALSMCHVFGIQNKEAFYHAIDLGIAMQLTNMCRDVDEDYKNGRIYLPELKGEYFEEKNHEKIQEIRRKYLRMANEYYTSGFRGIQYLPLRARIVVYLAGRLYQKIGHQIIKDNNYTRRSYISGVKKLIYTPLYIISFLFIRKNTMNHNHFLHQEIIDLPFTHAKI